MLRETYSYILSLEDDEGNEHSGCLVHFTPGCPGTWLEPPEPDEAEVVRPIGPTFDQQAVLAAVYDYQRNGHDY